MIWQRDKKVAFCHFLSLFQIVKYPVAEPETTAPEPPVINLSNS